MDLTARRYGIRPSEIIGLDSYTGLQFDMALAYKFSLLDEDKTEIYFRGILSAIQSIGRAFKVKYPKLGEFKPRYPQDKEISVNKEPTSKELLKSWGVKFGH